jgi:hypothetical protein
VKRGVCGPASAGRLKPAPTLFLLAISALLVSCDPIVHHILTLTFDDSAQHVTISASTKIAAANPGTPEFAEAEEQRQAVLAERDEWSIRFASAHPDAERVIYDRSGGQLSSVEHSATIPVENLQKFFFDTPISITVTRGEGWAELTMYAGSSTRASRQQRERVQTTLTAYSEYAAQYFESIRSMYAYLDEKPQRAVAMFTALFADEKEKTTPPEISDRERSLVQNVRDRMEPLAIANSDGADDREFDLVFNPFPAEIHVNLPTEPLAVEGFTRMKGGSVAVKTVTVLEAISSLEGRWITPDPLAFAMKTDDKTTAAELAVLIAPMKRRAEVVVSPTEIARAMIDKMRPAPRYRARWIPKPAPAP